MLSSKTLWGWNVVRSGASGAAVLEWPWGGGGGVGWMKKR